jgi:gas vesicle structural protein
VTGVERGATFIDVLDRVLDKGIVIDGWAQIRIAGVDLVTIDGWVVVASIKTYLDYAESLGLDAQVPGHHLLGSRA